jgi:hypothetical protein
MRATFLRLIFSGLKKPSVLVLLIALVGGGCAGNAPQHSSLTAKEGAAIRAMRKKDEIICLTSADLNRHKPVLIVLHGATDDPTEMMGIVELCSEKYNVLLYAYNYHQPIKRVATDLLVGIKSLRAKMRTLSLEDLTVVTYSYSASVFRQAVLVNDDHDLFADVTLIQLVPTAGGSYLARGLKNPIAAWFTGLASKPSATENPYGHIAQELWGQTGNRKFYGTIPARQVHTILIDDDLHSVARIPNAEIQRRYHNGIGGAVVIIPKSMGVTHEYFPSDPIGLQYLRKVLDTLPAIPDRDRVASAGHAANAELGLAK